MDFQNKYFQKFIRMRDSEVEKLLKKHPRSAKYFKINNIDVKVGETKEKVLLYTGDSLSINNIPFYQYTFDRYIEDKKEYIRSFFKTMPEGRTIDFIEKRCKFYYGDENVWVDNNKSVVIHFPKITITNSLEDSHILYDLYFKIRIYNNMFHSMVLARTTINENEIDKYLFSHTAHRTPGTYASSDALCLGATELKEIYNNVKLTNNFVLIDRLIVSIGGYLSWESLEGVPYNFISSCKNPRIVGSIAGCHHIETYINNALNLISNSNIKLRYKPEFKDNSVNIKILNTHEIDELLTHDSIPQFIRYNNVSYTFLKKADCPDSKIYRSEVVFKDEVIPVKIKKSKDNIEIEKKCHVDFLSGVIMALEKKILNYLVEINNE